MIKEIRTALYRLQKRVEELERENAEMRELLDEVREQKQTMNYASTLFEEYLTGEVRENEQGHQS